MSGSLEVHGVIQNWSSVKAYLFLDSANSQDEDEWKNDWDWRDENSSSPAAGKSTNTLVSPKDKKNEENWPQNCVVASSPMCDMIVVARGERAVFLTSEWDATSNTKYSKSFEGNLSQEGEKITSALCVPLISKKKSSPGAPDWTCIVVGFSDGYVRMYTETGSLLISQMFHDQSVGLIKCHSYQPASTAMEHDQLEEIFVLYKTVLVTMDGFGLFQTLRACRNHLARLQANAAESMIDPPPLSYKKWQYEGEDVSDCDSIGVQTPSTFDHLLAASIIGGVKAKPNKVPYTSNVFATVGDKPYLSFHYAQEGQAVPMFGDIAYAMASKLKSSLLSAATGWLGFGGGAIVKSPPANGKPEKPQIEPPTPMAARFGLPDKRRKGQTVVVSPCSRLSAVTDTLGRVMLIDNDRGIAVRVWKGYREAQCAWLQVDNDMNSKTRASGKKALFLVIYAPRRGQLEVFAMQQGPKVASFSVSKGGRLLVTSYGMMGLNNIPMKCGNKPVVQCLFLDQDAQLYALNIPFHLALCDNNNSKVKDMHLLKSIQRLLRENHYSEGDVIEMLFDIKTPAMINQAFKILTQGCKKVDVLAAVVESYLEKFCEDENRDLSVVFRIQTLLQLYSYLLKSSEMPPPYSETPGAIGNSSNENTILLCFHTTEKEIRLIKDIANKELFNKSPTKSVSFREDERFINVNEFFSSFDLEFDPIKMKSTQSSHESKLRLNLKSDNLEKLGKLLFCGCLNNNADLKEWKSFIKNSDLIPTELLEETLKVWCRHALMSSSFVDLMERLYHVVRALCELEGSETIVSKMNHSSTWWDHMRKVIASNPKIFYIYTFTIVCRAVSIDLQQHSDLEKRKSGEKKLDPELTDSSGASTSKECSKHEKMDCDKSLEEDENEEEWENVSLDLIRWNILLKQIEDLSFLSTILAQRPPLESPTLPVLPSATEELSVISLQEKGKGCIAELIGRWLTTIGIDPKALLDATELEQREATPGAELSDKELKQKQKDFLKKELEEEKMDVDPAQVALEESANTDSEINYISELLRCLKENFPVSLNSSIILANYCWEYCLEWNKDVEEIDYLNAAVACSSAVPSNFIRQGLMSMMWSTFISKQLASTVSRGKIGKEKHVEKLSGITSPENKERFLRACVKFLDDLMETNVQCEGSQAPRDVSRRKNHWASDVSNASLTDLAVLQPHANYEMILLHYQLTLAALFIQAFNIRKASMRLMNLFDTKARMMFFSIMSSPAPYSNVEVDLALKVLREEFLCLVVTNAIHAIPEELSMEEDDAESTEMKHLVPSHEGIIESEYWINKCFELGRIWGLDLDGLRINQVCEYYSCGYDLLGLETVGSVTAQDILGSKLLVVAGMRLHYIIQTNRESSMEIISSLSTNLTNWLNKLNYSKLRSLRFPKSSISELAEQLIQIIPESSYDYKLADELLHSSNFLP